MLRIGAGPGGGGSGPEGPEGAGAWEGGGATPREVAINGGKEEAFPPGSGGDEMGGSGLPVVAGDRPPPIGGIEGGGTGPRLPRRAGAGDGMGSVPSAEAGRPEGAGDAGNGLLLLGSQLPR